MLSNFFVWRIKTLIIFPYKKSYKIIHQQLLYILILLYQDFCNQVSITEKMYENKKEMSVVYSD